MGLVYFDHTHSHTQSHSFPSTQDRTSDSTIRVLWVREKARLSVSLGRAYHRTPGSADSVFAPALSARIQRKPHLGTLIHTHTHIHTYALIHSLTYIHSHLLSLSGPIVQAFSYAVRPFAVIEHQLLFARSESMFTPGTLVIVARSISCV